MYPRVTKTPQYPYSIIEIGKSNNALVSFHIVSLGEPIEKENKIERTSPASWAGKNMSKFWGDQIQVSYLNFMRNFLLTLKYVL